MAKQLTKHLLTAILLILTVVTTTHAQTAAATVAVTPANLEITAGTEAQLALSIDHVTDLYGFDLALEFDSTVVEIVDVDLELDGTQVGFGTFLEPGFVIRNTADNDLGRVHFVMTQLSPSQPKSGNGTLIVLTLRGKQAGATTAITLVRSQLGGPQGNEILASAVAGQVQIIAKQSSAPTSTPIEVQPPGMMLPTSTKQEPTSTPAPTKTFVPTAVAPVDTLVAAATETTMPTAATPDATSPAPANAATSSPTETPPTAGLEEISAVAEDRIDANEPVEAESVLIERVLPTPQIVANAQSKPALKSQQLPAQASAEAPIHHIGQGTSISADPPPSGESPANEPGANLTTFGIVAMFAVSMLVIGGFFLGRRNQ